MSKKVQQGSGLFSLPERIEKIYYTHGLFCSSQPIPVICFASFVIIFCCSPLIHVPLPGNTPQEYASSLRNYEIPSNQSIVSGEEVIKPLWYDGPPAGYVLQIISKTAAFPPHSQTSNGNVLRIPFKTTFDILEIVRNYQFKLNDSIITIDDVCLHVSESVHHKIAPGLLPHYGCLIVSPINFFKQDFNIFLENNDLLKTVLDGDWKHIESFPPLKDIFFGLPWKETGVNKILGAPKPIIISQAVTIVLSHYIPGFLEGLQKRLYSSFSINAAEHNSSSEAQKNISHIHFPDQYNLIEFIPLLVTYIILFLYIYFSVRKIELVKSKLGMAFSAVVTVLASLCMSVGICTWFGLNFTLKSGEIYLKEIFPYLVVIIGLENILVLTKSVVSTPVHLDVKVRVAQGLSKEGWSITKNLCTELTILTFGFFTFIPAIQEFCMLAVVGLLSDFFLQLVFFATILSIDIRRMELSDLQKQSLLQGIKVTPPEQLNHMFPLFRCPVVSGAPKNHLKKSRSSSRLNVNSNSSAGGYLQQQPRVVTAQYNAPNLVKVPKRLRLAYFWARCRIFQRALMVTFVVWLALMAYKSGVNELFNSSSETVTQPSITQPKMKFLPRTSPSSLLNYKSGNATGASNLHSVNLDRKVNISIWRNHRKAIFAKLRQKHVETWKQLLYSHWPTLFGFYNISLQGRYISILPSIFLSIPLDTNEAIRWHHTEGEASGDSDHLNLISSHDTRDMEDITEEESEQDSSAQEAIYPSSPIEMLLTFILAIPSVLFIVYIMIILYRCICSRNYAEWRSSWSQETKQQQCDVYTQLVMEAMPIVLEGHPQDIECMTTDGAVVVSSCLSGQLRIWDSSSGECLTIIDRRKAFSRQRSKSDHDPDDVEDVISDYESGSPPSRSDYLTDHNRKHLSAPSVLCGGEINSHNQLNNFHITTSNNCGEIRTSNCFSHDTLTSLLYDDHENNSSHQRHYRDLFKHEPNLSTSIVTNFSKLPAIKHYNRHGDKDSNTAFDFSQFDRFYAEPNLADTADHQPSQRIQTKFSELSLTIPPGVEQQNNMEISRTDDMETLRPLSPVWCLDCQDNLIAAGCSNGRIELWDGSTGTLKCVHDDGNDSGVTGICIVGSRLVAARLHGALDFLEIKPIFNCTENSMGIVASAHRRTHVRQSSNCSLGRDSKLSWDDDIICVLLQTARAHQQPITELKVEGGRAVTGSQDHSLKVFRVEDAVCQLTLHGHHGPITALFIDKFSPMTAASGAQDGAICLWDLMTGACICRLQGHDGAVAAVTYTAAYVLSAGIDTRLLVWERFQGHLLNTINLQHCYCSSMVMLTDNLLLTARQGSLIVWDIRIGEPVRIVRLGHSDQSIFVREIQHVGNAVVCDYGNQLRVVQFPTIVEKAD